MRRTRLTASAAMIGTAAFLAVPGTASAIGSADLPDALAAGSSNIPGALPDVDVHLNVAELTASEGSGGTDVTFSPPNMPANTTCYGPYVYTGELDAQIKDIAGGFMQQKQQDSGGQAGDGATDSDGTTGDGSAGNGTTDSDGTTGEGSAGGASADAATDGAATNDAAVDDAVAEATGSDAVKVAPVQDDPSTRVRPGDSGTLTFDLDNAEYTALATCMTGGKVPAGTGTDGTGTDHPADSAQGVRGTVYLRAIHYDFGVAGQLLGSLQTGSIGSLTDLFT